MSDFPHTPFPFNVTPVSPMFKLSPVSSNVSQGWVPSCSTPDCVPTASWSTGTVGATLSFEFWGWDVAFDGSVKGNLSVEVSRDGVQESWDPSANVLFRSPGQPTDGFYSHNITLKVVSASAGAELTINQARVNGSSFTDKITGSARWILPSSDPILSYKGFVPQASSVRNESQTTYVSSKVGDSALTQFNASAFLLYGPCGPTSGLVKLWIDYVKMMVNTSRPIASDDCLLFQSYGVDPEAQHQLFIQNLDGSRLGINRIEYFGTVSSSGGHGTTLSGAEITGIVVGVLIAVLSILAGIVIIQRKRGKKSDQMI